MKFDRNLTARTAPVFSLANPALHVAWLIFCCVFFGIFVYAVFNRLTYPYPLEWLEPVTPDVVSRILAGLPVYCEPTIFYVPSMKTSLYHYVVALLSSMVGTGLLAGRIVSILSIVGVCFFIWQFVRRETGTYTWAFFGAALFIATYHISEEWFDIARLNSLFLLFTIAGAYVLRFSRKVGRSRYHRYHVFSGVLYQTGSSICRDTNFVFVGFCFAEACPCGFAYLCCSNNFRHGRTSSLDRWVVDVLSDEGAKRCRNRLA